jgi:hypothetical protein
MKSLAVYLFISCILSVANAFAAQPSSAKFSSPLMSHATSTQLNVYVPDGLSKEQYEKIKKAEANKYKGKNLGALGPRGFKSRSMEAWQKAYEKGQASHAFAPIGFHDKLKKGLIKKEEVPYMVRGGSWDNSDVFGARRLRWNKNDVEYARGGYKKEQSASLLGSGPGLDWTGSRPRNENNRKLVPGFS